MDSTEKEWPSLIGRVEFHLNGGFTKIMIWAGGPHEFDLPTEKIPPELRKVGSWLNLKLDPVNWWTVAGAGKPDPYIKDLLEGKKRSDTEP